MPCSWDWKFEICQEGLRVGCYLEKGSKPLKSIGDYLKVSTLGVC